MPHYEHHVFVCTNRRESGHVRGSCADKGSEAIAAAFKQALKEQGLADICRSNTSGCLNQCERGPAVVVYPEQVWYTVPSTDAARRIVTQHLVDGVLVEALTMKDPAEQPV